MASQAEIDAWDAYLSTCRLAVSYDEVEGWAWEQLMACLAELVGKKPKKAKR